MDFKDKLLTVQTMLKAPKDKYNSFGKYQYRSAEGILESVKPLLAANGLLLTLHDELVAPDTGGRLFIRAVATLKDCESPDFLTVSAFAEIATEKKGMDVSQMTGTASSYARKYALNGLFLIDDTKDADTDEYKTERETKANQEPKEELPKRKQRKEPKEDPYKDVANEKISAVKAKSLEGRLNAMNVNVSALLAKYGVLEVADLTEGQHLEIIEKLRKHEKK